MTNIRLIILGSGTSIPLPYRASPSIVMIREDNAVLFDMGPGTLRQLARLGISSNRIEHIFITHFHADHTADLVHFLFVTRNPSIFEVRRPFIITGPEGLKGFIGDLQRSYRGWLDIPATLMEIEELGLEKPENRSCRDFDVRTQALGHTPNSLAYRVSPGGGRSFVYSGDTGFCEEIVTFSKEADVLILECSFPDGEEVEGHLTPSQAGRIAALANVKKLVLTHFYPEVLRTDIARQCRKSYHGELVLGRDMLDIAL